MKHCLRRLMRVAVLGALIWPLASVSAGAAVLSARVQPERQVQTLTDMAGRTVLAPVPVRRIATLGSVPVINSLVFALGAGPGLVNGLPDFARHPRWKLQYVFAPQIQTLPSLQNADRSPRMEALMQSQADLVLTMDRASADTLQRVGIPALFLAWRHPEDVKTAIALLGAALGREAQAERFVRHFDETLAYVSATLSTHAPVRPSVLYFSPRTLTQPHLVAEWWIRAAGGRSVTDDGRQMESRSLTLEQVLAWNPDIVVVSSPDDKKRLLTETRFAQLAAVQRQRVLVTPTGAHIWGNRSAEQHLTVLWAAAHFHPELFDVEQLLARTQEFYENVFEQPLSATQLHDMLALEPRF